MRTGPASTLIHEKPDAKGPTDRPPQSKKIITTTVPAKLHQTAELIPQEIINPLDQAIWKDHSVIQTYSIFHGSFNEAQSLLKQKPKLANDSVIRKDPNAYLAVLLSIAKKNPSFGADLFGSMEKFTEAISASQNIEYQAPYQGSTKLFDHIADLIEAQEINDEQFIRAISDRIVHELSTRGAINLFHKIAEFYSDSGLIEKYSQIWTKAIENDKENRHLVIDAINFMLEYSAKGPSILAPILLGLSSKTLKSILGQKGLNWSKPPEYMLKKKDPALKVISEKPGGKDLLHQINQKLLALSI